MRKRYKLKTNNRRRRKKQKQLHIPKFIKFKRYFQHTLKGISSISTNTKIRNGAIGLKVCESAYLTISHYDMIKKFLNPITKNKNREIKMTNLWINFFTDKAMTAKSLQSRMGRGKGLPSVWYGRVYNGQLIVEIRSNIDFNKSYHALRLVSKKLPIKTQIIKINEPSLIRKFNLLPETEITALLKPKKEETDTAKKLAFLQKRSKKIIYIA